MYIVYAKLALDIMLLHRHSFLVIVTVFFIKMSENVHQGNMAKIYGKFMAKVRRYIVFLKERGIVVIMLMSDVIKMYMFS